MKRTPGLIYFVAVLITNVSVYNTNYVESSFFALSFDRKSCEIVVKERVTKFLNLNNVLSNDNRPTRHC